MVEGGASSASAEAAGNGAANNNGRTAGNNANPAVQNGVPLTGEPFLAQLISIGGSIFIQPLVNPIGQAPVQQLIPIGALQQAGALFVSQAGGANVIPQPQGQVTQSAGGGHVTLFAFLPQRNTAGNPQSPAMIPGQMQLISTNGQINQQRLAAAGRAAGRGRFRRSGAAHPRKAQSPVMKEMAAEEAESSGMESEENLTY